MREATGNIWDLVQPTEAIVITTNGTVTKDGRGVMGRGVAFQAKTRIKGIERLLGDEIVRHGNHAWFLAHGGEKSPGPPYGIIFMPVKHNWWEKADLELIARSCHEMVDLADREQDIVRRANLVHPEKGYPMEFENIWLPRPGCGNGRLRWEDVKPRIEPILDDRFIATHWTA